MLLSQMLILKFNSLIMFLQLREFLVFQSQGILQSQVFFRDLIELLFNLAKFGLHILVNLV